MAMTTQQARPIETALSRPADTAKYFNISAMTLHRWRKQDGFPQPLKRGQVVLYSVPAITEWLAGEEC